MNEPKEKGPPMGGNRGQRLLRICLFSAAFSNGIWIGFYAGSAVLLLVEVFA